MSRLSNLTEVPISCRSISFHANNILLVYNGLSILWLPWSFTEAWRQRLFLMCAIISVPPPLSISEAVIRAGRDLPGNHSKEGLLPGCASSLKHSTQTHRVLLRANKHSSTPDIDSTSRISSALTTDSNFTILTTDDKESQLPS